MSRTSEAISDLNDAIESLQRKVGVNNSTDPQSLDWKISHLQFDGGHHTHQQTLPAVSWNVNHNLGFKPGGIYCEDSAGTMLQPSVEHVDDNNLILTFVGATDGYAVFS